MTIIRICLIFSAAVTLCLSSNAWAAAQEKQSPIEHIIVILLENHSFDNLFGTFPGADGFKNAKSYSAQTDKEGMAYETLPRIIDTRTGKKDKRFPTEISEYPFPIEEYVGPDEETGDLVHRFYHEQEQINHGRMDRFAAISDAGGLPMGYYDGSTLGLWKYARKYTLSDHFFHAAFGGSFLNHFWMVCACTPRFENAPRGLVAPENYRVKSHAADIVTSDGYVVNTMLSANGPHPSYFNFSTDRLPAQEAPTIGDRLSEKNISWAWYAGGWNNAVNGRPDGSFQFHHQPFAYFKNFGDGTQARREHLKDELDLLDDIANGTLPAVAFYKPIGEFNLHPGYADLQLGDVHIVDILQAIETSKAWKHSVIIITFDENGGYWDHVAPPVIDRWGPGVRVPTIIISPFAKKHFVDHTVYDTTSILKFIERRFELEPLGTRDAGANDMYNALTLPRPSRHAPIAGKVGTLPQPDKR